jgi:hypothetical protein
MVVNTESATEAMSTSSHAIGGRHWFVAAWYVEPEEFD